MIEDRCGSCGFQEKFLRKKGASQVGLYCWNCEKWVKWVGKKEQVQWVQRGFKVYPEDFSPPSAQVNNLQNMGLVEEEVNFEPDEEYMENNTSGNILLQQSSMATQVAERKGLTKFDSCEVCGPNASFNSMGKENPLTIDIFDGVMSVRNKGDLHYINAFKVKFCPNCGKQV